MSFDIRNFTKKPVSTASYARIAKQALPGWDLSLSFVGPARAKALNLKLRKKSYVPNVLSYEVGEKSGEIIICLDIAKKQSGEYGLSYPDFTAYLFIHGLMHLKGHPHGPTMERHERALMSRFVHAHSFNEKTAHRNRH